MNPWLNKHTLLEAILSEIEILSHDLLVFLEFDNFCSVLKIILLGKICMFSCLSFLLKYRNDVANEEFLVPIFTNPIRKLVG